MIGTRLGPYEITAKLGEGGMGEVWRATDTKLRREVAVKVLPEAFTEDKERLARFEREAQLLAQLQHPNIASIYGMEESGTTRALVMELVEGPTLAERLAEGSLPLSESLAIARQIAEALEEAHEKGIVHRDLKPQNIKASIEGKVKVLDFGLAKAMDPTVSSSGAPVTVSPTLMNSPTLTAAGTQLGVILGTAAYMSPEQAKGLAVDERSDIWAFGVTLYEMLVGGSLFAGETVGDTLAAVIRKDVDLALLPEETPPALRRLVRRCLERNPRNRLHSIADARIVIDEVLAGKDESGDERPGSRAAGARWLRWAAPLALVIAALLGAAVDRLARPPGSAEARGLEVALAVPSGESLPEGDDIGLAISADGRRQVLEVRDESGAARLLLRDLDRAELIPLPGSEGAAQPSLAPNGEAVAFFRNGALWRLAIAGGPPIRLADSGTATRGATWSSDGYVYFSPGTGSPLLRVPQSGGSVEPVTTLLEERRERTHRWPAALPDGSAVLFTSDTEESTEEYDDARIEAVRPATGERTVVLEGSSQARFLPPDHLVFGRGGTLFAVRFDPERLATSGDPVPLVQGVATDVPSGAVRFDVSASGAGIWVPGEAGKARRRLAWIEPDGSSYPLEVEENRYMEVTIAPDERRLGVVFGQNTTDLWSVDLERGARSRLTFTGDPSDVVWTNDGKRVAYSSVNGDGGRDIFWKPADGSGEAELLVTLEGDDWPSDFSLDDRILILEHTESDKGSDLLQLDLESGEVRPLITGPNDQNFAEISPDGRWIAYCSDEDGGRLEIVVRRYPELTGKWQVSIDGGIEPRWSPEGDALYFRERGTLYRVAVETADGFVAGAPQQIATGFPRPPFANAYDVGRGNRVLRIEELGPERRGQAIHFALDLAARARELTASRR